MSFIFILLCILSCTSSVLTAKDDGFVLLKMKQQLGNPDILSSWVKGFDYCNPAIISSAFVNIMCDVNRRVYYLQLNNFDIHTPFPKAICGLTVLQFLEINHIPGLNGSIPSCITKLINLSSITIVETSLSGHVPAFSNNTNIAIINLSGNRLSGRIPPSLSTLSNLGILNLSSNYLTGKIPPGIFSHFIDDHPSLLLSNNNLTGEIPKSYGSVNFYTINVGNNQLSGDASFVFGFEKSTEFIILANNLFEFDFSYVVLPPLLSTLDLSHNKIYGKVPLSFANAYELWYPNLSFNRLCGELPQGGIMSRVDATVFANNTCLCGYPLSPCFNPAPEPAIAPTPTPMLAPN